MPLKSGLKTPQERVFIERFAATGDRMYAASQAGYADPAKGALRALSRPSVLEEVRRQQEERMVLEALPLAVATLIKCMESKDASWNAKIAAGKVVMEYAGPRDQGSDKPSAEMTIGEIDLEIARLRAKGLELETANADAAQSVDATIVSTTSPDPDGVFS